jgi:hypothetical protein
MYLAIFKKEYEKARMRESVSDISLRWPLLR